MAGTITMEATMNQHDKELYKEKYNDSELLQQIIDKLSDSIADCIEFRKKIKDAENE